MTTFQWPDLTAILDDLRELLNEAGHDLQLRSRDDLEAGFDRAKIASSDDPSLDMASLAALLFEGVAMRHALVDGNKRLALQCMTIFLDLNGAVFDPPEIELYHRLIDLIAHKSDVAELAAYIRNNCVELPEV